MSEVIVDTEKLAHGLKKGIASTNTIFASAEYHQMLRYTACGLVSSAIHEYCQSQYIPSQLLISSPELPFDPDMQHVVPAVGNQPLDQTIVDASYSQFLRYVACRHQLDEGKGGYPPEEIVSFSFSGRDIFLDWIVSVTANYQIRHPGVPIGGEYTHTRPLGRASTFDIRKVYSKIWDPNKLKAWSPPEYVVADGKAAARLIPDDAIELS